MHACSEPYYESISLNDDITAILSDKPGDADHYIDKLYAELLLNEESVPTRETVTFVQFADTHMDYKYLEGATADCGLNYCCRAESETGQGSVKAGKFGAKGSRCDVSSATVETVLDQVVSHNPDYIFWSGDNTAHDDPFVSQDEVNAELMAVIDVVANKLGDRDLTVAMGNHDAFPNGMWDFEGEGPSFPGREALK